MILLKMHIEELALKRHGHSYFFAPDLIEYEFVGVSLSDAKFMGGEYSNESRNEIYNGLRSSNYWYLHHYLTPPKKHVLNYFALEMTAIIVASWHRREDRVRGRRERISFNTH